jgi:hypothetical protein
VTLELLLILRGVRPRNVVPLADTVTDPLALEAAEVR